MSLIQEALARQQKEQENQTPEDEQPPSVQPPASSSPPPPPPPPSTETTQAPGADEPADLKHVALAPQKKERGAWRTLAGALLVLVLLVGGGIWIGQLALVKWRTGEAAPKPAPVQPAPAAVEPEPPAPTTVDMPVVESDEPDTAEPPPVTTPAEPPPEPEPPPVPEPAPAQVVPEPPPEPVDWPHLKMTSCGRGVNAFVMINGQALSTGDAIEGVKVIKIHDRGADLEYKGAHRFLKVGGSIQ